MEEEKVMFYAHFLIFIHKSGWAGIKGGIFAGWQEVSTVKCLDSFSNTFDLILFILAHNVCGQYIIISQTSFISRQISLPGTPVLWPLWIWWKDVLAGGGVVSTSLHWVHQSRPQKPHLQDKVLVAGAMLEDYFDNFNHPWGYIISHIFTTYKHTFCKDLGLMSLAWWQICLNIFLWNNILAF